MRTTIDLDASVLKELRRRSERDGKSMGQVASELLAKSMTEDQGKAGPPLRWITRNLGRPRVDLEDKEAVRAILDSAR